MSKKVLIVIAVLLLILAVGWGVMSSKKTADTSTNKVTNTDVNTPSTNSLKDLLTGGLSQTCTFDSQGNTGSIYVSGGKVRGDFDVAVSGETTKSHMIIMDSTSYMWTDGQTTGFKMTFDPDTKPVANNSAQPAFDPTANNNYKCSTWVADSTKFTLPSNVNFTEFKVPSADSLKAPTTGSGSASQCSYCDSLTGEDKTQCLTALKCN